MITLIGTGHVFNLSQGILDVLDEIQPDLIGVELDENRFFKSKNIHQNRNHSLQEGVFLADKFSSFF